MAKLLNTRSVYAALEQKGLSAAAIAENLSVSREAVSKWLNEEAFPRPDKLLKLALLLDLKLDQLVVRHEDEKEPVIAFRKRGASKTTELHIARAKEMGRLLKPLVTYLPFDRFKRPPTLKSPSVNYRYLQELAQEVRRNLGVTETEPVDFRHLIKYFADLQMVLIPVLWGEKDRHENALHIFLPDSMTTWVYLNLDVEAHDFKFWMAHELGHGLAPELTENEAEDFADAFAGTLLFPELLAKDAYSKITAKRGKAAQMNTIKQLAEDNLISPITVYLEINRYAEDARLPNIDLGSAIYGAAKNLSKGYHNVSASLFGNERPDAKHFIERCSEAFDTPFFATLKSYLLKEQKGHGYIQAILDIPLLDAKEIHSVLA